MKVLNQYKQFNYYILSSTDKNELLYLLDDVKNPIDAIIDSESFRAWNSELIDEIIKYKQSVIIRDSNNNEMVGYMLLKDYSIPHSRNEQKIMIHPSIVKYNRLLEDLEKPIIKIIGELRPGIAVKLVDSGVSRKYCKNGVAIESLKWVVKHSRNLGYRYLLVEALSPVGIKLARNMGNKVLCEIVVDKYEGFEHLKNFKVQFTFQKLNQLKSKL